MDPSWERDGRVVLDPSEAEVEAGHFSVVCPRHGVHADIRVERVSGSVRSFSCSVPGEDGPARRRCQAACASWIVGDV